jgi:hypothetical protein
MDPGVRRDDGGGGDARSKPVIPAEAGIQTGYPFGSFAGPARLDSRLRGNDG